MQFIKHLFTVSACIVFINTIQAQSVVFSKVYNNFNRFFEHSPTEFIYNNESIFAFTNSKESYFLSGHSFSNYSITIDTPILTLFNLKIDLYGDTIWQRIDDLSINGTEGIGDFYEYPDKSLISFGTISDYFYSNYEFQDGLVYKMDSMGNELWRVRYHFGDDTHFHTPFTEDNGETFQVLGFANMDTVGINYDAFISTIDSSGNLLNNIQLGGSENDFLYALEYLDNGNYLVCGHTFSFGVSGSDIWLMEVDTNGLVLWQKFFGGNFYERIYNSKGLVIKNENIYIVGAGIDTLTENGITINTSGGWLMKLDMQGNLIWDKIFIRGSSIDVFKGIQVWDNETFIIGAQTQTYFDDDQEPTGWLLKVDTSGNIIWDREIAKYEQDPSGIQHYVDDMLVTQDRGILLGGYVIANAVVDVNGYFHRNDAWLTKTDSCGYTVGDIPEPMLLIDSIVGKTVYITDQSTNYCTANLDWGDGTELESYYAYENNLPLTEKHFSHTYSQTGDYSIKTTTLAGEEFRDYEVQVLSLSNEEIPLAPFEKGGMFSIYPNPADEYIIVQILNQVQSDDILMTIHKLNGEAVPPLGARGLLNPKLYQQKIDVSSLNNGVYFVKFEIDGVLIATEKLVITR